MISSGSRLKRPNRIVAHILFGLASLGLTAAWATTPDPSLPADPADKPSVEAFDPWRVEHEGIAVELSIEPGSQAGLQEGESAVFRFKIIDEATGRPLGGLYPAAWMSRLGDDEVPSPGACVEKVEEFVGGSILAQPELDLNVYYVLAMNHDATITVVDPLFGFGGTKLLGLINLPAPGEDWVLGGQKRKLFVSIPSADRVTVADAVHWKKIQDLEVGPNPSRVALQGDGAYVWVSIDPGVAVIDARNPRVSRIIETGIGPHDIAFSEDHQYAFVTNYGSDTVSIVDVGRLAKVKDLKTGDGPASVGYSPLAAAAYVTHALDGRIVVLDEQGIRTTFQAEIGLGQIRSSPGGRLVFALNPEQNTVDIIDTAKNRILQTGDVNERPIQVTFSDELAYVLHGGSEIVLMIPLDEVGVEGRRVPVVDFPGGEQPFEAEGKMARASAMVQAPGANAMLVANPMDQVIYFYKEGMAAPMGGFRNYERRPRAVLVIDRSLRERTSPGLYETAAKLRRPGKYEIAFYLDTPRIVHCFETEVSANPELERRRQADLPAKVEPLFEALSITDGQAASLEFRLRDPRTDRPLTGLGDVVVMAYAAGNWQRRFPAQELGDGVYRATFEPPGTGSYSLAVECRSQKLRFHQSPQMPLRVVEAEQLPDSEPADARP